MSFVRKSADSVYTKYLNPVYVTAITSPEPVHTLLPSSPPKPLVTYHREADWTSQLSSARSCRRHTDYPYVVRRTGTSGHKYAAKTGVNSVVKSLGKLKFSAFGDAVNVLGSERRTGVHGTQAGDGSVHISDCSGPSLLDDPLSSRSFGDLEMSVLNADDCNSSVSDDRSLSVVVKTLNDFHVAE